VKSALATLETHHNGTMYLGKHRAGVVPCAANHERVGVQVDLALLTSPARVYIWLHYTGPAVPDPYSAGGAKAIGVKGPSQARDR
jgi:hypothetical protein